MSIVDDILKDIIKRIHIADKLHELADAKNAEANEVGSKLGIMGNAKSETLREISKAVEAMSQMFREL
jgi:hypothetical protein